MATDILLVDDDPSALRVLAESLGQRGFSVRTATSAEEAGKLFAQEPAGLLITDVILPDGVGYDLISQLRNAPGGESLPVIFTSGMRKSPGEREQARRSYGAADFLIKPFPIQTLLARLQEIFPGFQPGAARKAPSDARLHGKKASGEIKQTTFSKLFCHFHQSKATGILRMTNGDSWREVYFTSGLPVSAASNIQSESLGRHLLSIGRIRYEDYQRVLEAFKPNGKRFGEMLIEEGLISEQELYKAIRFHLREKILVCFGLHSGTYEFTHTGQFPEWVEYFDYNTYDLFYTGIKRYYAAETLAGELAKLYELRIGLSALGREARGQIPLTPAELSVFGYFDGKRTLSRILKEHEGIGAMTLPLLYASLLLGILEVQAPSPTEPPPAPAESGGRGAVAAEIVSNEAEVPSEKIHEIVDFLAQQADTKDLTNAAPLPAAVDEKKLSAEFSRRIDDEAVRLVHAGHYQILGIPRNAQDVEVEEACRRRRAWFTVPREVHATLAPAILEHVQEFQRRIEKARECLLDIEKRAQYDETQDRERQESLRQAEIAFVQGKDALEKSNYAIAESALRTACDLNPQDMDAYAYLAFALFLAHPRGQGDSRLRQSIDMLKSALDENPNCAAAPYLRARIAWHEGDIPEADRALSHALRINPDLTEAALLRDEINRTLK